MACTRLGLRSPFSILLIVLAGHAGLRASSAMLKPRSWRSRRSRCAERLAGFRPGRFAALDPALLRQR